MSVRISAKQLGWLKMNDFCPRCLWLMQNHPLPNESVYHSPISRIFRQFENFLQNSISQVMRQTGKLPSWLSSALQSAFSPMPNVKTVSTQRTWTIQVGGAELTGRADLLCQLEDGTWLIADFKLSHPSNNYAPLYETQLNAYAFLAREHSNLQVHRLALIYFELDEDMVAMPSIGGIMATMKCTVMPVSVWSDDEVVELVRQMANLLSLQQPPDPKPGCRGCQQDLSEWARKLADWLMVESQ